MERQELYRDHEPLFGVVKRNTERNIARLRSGRGTVAAKRAFKDDNMAELPGFAPSGALALNRVLDFDSEQVSCGVCMHVCMCS